MHKASRMLFLLASTLLSATCPADDTKSSTKDSAALPEVTLSLEAIHEQWDYASRWRLPHPVEPIAYTRDWSQPTVKVDFYDSGALARVSKLRSFSLLTFAEIGRARLFLGVDDNGMVGLHMRAFHRVGDERYLEVVRMPYLKIDQPTNDTE